MALGPQRMGPGVLRATLGACSSISAEGLHSGPGRVSMGTRSPQ